MITIDSNAPYTTVFSAESAGDAVYMTADDPLLGRTLAVVYLATPASPRLSVILIGAHGTSGYVDMTLDRTSRFWGACRALAPAHRESLVRRALAIAVLRTYATMDHPLREKLLQNSELQHFDEAAAGALGSRFRLVYGRFPREIGGRLVESGLLSAKKIKTSVLDIVYEDSDLTIAQNNELVYLLGEQLEQLFDPLTEYSPEPAENLYVPPSNAKSTLDNDPQDTQNVCEELYLLQSRVRGDLVDLLQNFLVPLRVQVLKGQLPEATIEKLNTAFPPTIDELFRVNNMLYEALRAALPLGAFEVLRACGMTIPYFYRASMRHEAATRNFKQHIADMPASVRVVVEHYSEARLETVLCNQGLHLSSIKLLLDRLASSQNWTPEQRALVEEFHHVATGTIDSFARGKPEEEEYNKRVFTPTGKLLVEIANGWPAELEYGWLNRRVVTIFDAVDVLEPDDRFRQLQQVVIVFTDTVVVCQPSEPIPSTSLSGLHVPAIGDMLMHAMLNEAPLDSNIPPLKVVAWAPILDVTFASYGPNLLYVTAQPASNFSCSYHLVRPDADANVLVERLAKAKMTTKTQHFHLFRLNSDDLTIYSTVQELAGYKEEVNRTSLAVFLSSTVTEETLDSYDLAGAVSLAFNPQESGVIDVEVLSKLGYSNRTSVRTGDLRALVMGEISYLATLAHSSQNPAILSSLVTSNTEAVSQLLNWATHPGVIKPRRHRRSNPKLNTSTRPFLVTRKSANSLRPIGEPRKAPQPPKSSSSSSKDKQNPVPRSPPSVSGTSGKNATSGPASPHQHLRKKQSFSDSVADNENSLANPPEELFYSSHSLSSMAVQSKDTNDQWEATTTETDDDAAQAEQRDVDAWYHQISTRDAESLSSELSEVSLHDRDYFGDSGNMTRNSSSASEPIQIGGFLNRSTSELYNGNAGRSFAPISSEKSNLPESIASLQSDSGTGSEAEDGDFTYLAELVNAGSDESSGDERLYPDLRDTSVVRLGSYIMRNDKSHWDVANAAESKDTLVLGSDAPTPTLESIQFRNDASDSSASIPKSSSITNKAPATTNWDFDLDADDSGYDKNSDLEEEAATYLAWADRRRASRLSGLSVSSAISSSSRFPPSLPPPPQSYQYPESKSSASFKRMVMSSSLNTLQLASFTMQLEQKARTATVTASRELVRIQESLTAMFNEKLPRLDLEPSRRQQVASMTWILLRFGYDQLVQGLLEVEWIRRTRVSERAGPVVTGTLWKVNG